jgi:two-component system LytT family sensor kinase
MRKPERTRDVVLWVSVAASLALALATVVVLRLTTLPEPPAGAGPMLPRVRGPVGPVAPGTLLRAIGVGSLTWYASILTAPAFVLLSRRLSFEGRGWMRSLTVYGVVIGGLVLGTALLQVRLAFAGAPQALAPGVVLRVALTGGALPFIAVAALAQALEAGIRAHERALEAARVGGQLAEARLEALTLQLQPHFLFNTLQGISTLIRSDPEAADRMLTRLSDLLRDVLARRDERELPLDEELRVLSAYLDIARWRFGSRLTVQIVADAAARRGRVPFMLVQPLVENAIRHGVESRAGAGTVRIAAERVGDVLRLEVSDDGARSTAEAPGAGDARAHDPEDEDPRPGIGLENTRARLAELHPGTHALDFGPTPGGGFAVRIEVPYRTTGEGEG